MCLDAGSYVGTDYFVNRAKPTETIRFYGAPTINKNENSLVFGGSSYGVYTMPAALNEYTILVLASYYSTKSENDIIGTGVGTPNLLMMNYLSRTRVHQWTPAGGLFQIDSDYIPPKMLIGQRFTSTGGLSLLEDGYATKSISIASTTIPKTIYIGARSSTTPNSFFNGRLLAIKIYNKALTDAEVYNESLKMKARYA